MRAPDRNKSKNQILAAVPQDGLDAYSAVHELEYLSELVEVCNKSAERALSTSTIIFREAKAAMDRFNRTVLQIRDDLVAARQLLDRPRGI